MSGPRVLIVDDEPQLRRALRRFLEGHGFEVKEAEDGRSALVSVHAYKPDVILLDLMLPDMSGVQVCADLRRSEADVPIIVLSVLGDERTKVDALDQGADDYLTKPFGTNELLARMRAAIRRGAKAGELASVISAGDLTLDFGRRTVTLEGSTIHLTPTEYSLLKYLVVNAGKVLTHPMILRAVWGPGYAEDSQVLRTYINQLRSKLHDDPSAPRFIMTDPGVGYRFLMPESTS